MGKHFRTKMGKAFSGQMGKESSEQKWKRIFGTKLNNPFRIKNRIIHFKKILLIAVAGFLMGCYNPEPIPEAAAVVVVTPTTVPNEGWTCFTGKIEMVNGTEWEPRVSMTIIGEQIICAKEWKISNLFSDKPVRDCFFS